VDNSQEIYFPDVLYDQKETGACAAASIVYSGFTYELNRLRDIPSNAPEKKYPPNFVYNYLNDGDLLNGTAPVKVIKILQKVGCPNVETWGNLNALDYLRWMSGYEKYIDTMQNRMDDFKYIQFNTPEDLYILKHWLNDHGDGSSVGGVVPVCFLDFDGEKDQLPPESSHPDDYFYKSTGNCDHVVTIVGYCDGIKYDFNGDGQYTNEGDDATQWEIGAVKIANSFGEGWPYSNNGYIWMPYRVLARSDATGYALYPIENYNPETIIKIKTYINARNKLSVGVAYGENANVTQPNDFEATIGYFNQGVELFLFMELMTTQWSIHMILDSFMVRKILAKYL